MTRTLKLGDPPEGPTGVTLGHDSRGNPVPPFPDSEPITPGRVTPPSVTDTDELVAQSGTSEQLRDDQKPAGSDKEALLANPWATTAPGTYRGLAPNVSPGAGQSRDAFEAGEEPVVRKDATDAGAKRQAQADRGDTAPQPTPRAPGSSQ